MSGREALKAQGEILTAEQVIDWLSRGCENSAKGAAAAMAIQRHDGLLRQQNADLTDELTDWILVADGIKHNWRCGENGDPCMRCQLEAATALAARTEGPTEEEVIAGVVSHWFTQGGKAQFGMIPPCQNADEVVSEILERVRNPKPDSWAAPSATERWKDQA